MDHGESMYRVWVQLLTWSLNARCYGRLSSAVDVEISPIKIAIVKTIAKTFIVIYYIILLFKKKKKFQV